MRRVFLYIFLCLNLILISQTNSRVNIGVNAGYSLERYSFSFYNYEFQAFTHLQFKSWLNEFNYSIMPTSVFGVKNKLVIMTGKSSSIGERASWHLLIGGGYSFAPNHNTFEKSTKSSFYPNQYNVSTKLGFVFVPKNHEKIEILSSLYIQTERVFLKHRLLPSSLYFIPSINVGVRLKIF